MGRLRMVSLGSVSGDFTADSPTLHVDSANDRVGVNTLSPTAALTVDGDIYLSQNGDTIGRDDGSTRLGNFQFGALTTIYRWGGVDRVSFLENGNVGIGVTDPDELLEVAGRLHLGQVDAPGTTTDKLYNVGGTLTWNGTALSAGGTVDPLDAGIILATQH